MVRDRDGQPLRLFLPADDIWRWPVTLDELPPQLIDALLASEDRWFYRHPGVNPLAILRAARDNLRAGTVVSGASTLTMQIARMAEPKERTLRAKAVELFRALQLERRYTKRELLEIYLNLAPYGGNLEGVGAAAWFYFGKEPAALSSGEIALLTALPRYPVGYDPTRYPERARKVRSAVLDRLVERGVVSAEEAVAARRQTLPRKLQPVPFVAPHFAREVARRMSPATSLRTSLDRRVQRIAEGSVARRIDELRALGIGNAAVVVLDLETRQVQAWVGSAGFFDGQYQGQVDGVLARRSPGSTLKPFLYALALEQGDWIPDSFLLDVPTDFSGYVAENYDGLYRGRVTLRTALAESLNSPAVRLLSRLGLADFLTWLERGGVTSLDRGAGAYGLPLVLGAGEVSLLELTGLYAALGGGGIAAVPRWTSGGEGTVSGSRWISAGAARQVADMLTEVRRPDLPESWSLARDVPAIAWKTGTSYGHRDAWAVGFSDRQAVGVWVGNFDGAAVQGISGSRHAGPLLFDLFRALAVGRSPAAPGRPAPGTTARREVCSVSHHRPGPYCPRRHTVETLVDHTRLPECRLHRRIFVDTESGEWLAGRCLGERPHQARVVVVEPAELLAWRRGRGDAVDTLPPLADGCSGGLAIAPPRIVSPDATTPYRLRAGVPRDFQKIALVARHGGGDLFWFLNGRLLGSGSADQERYWLPEAGDHRLVVVDQHGRSDGIDLRVE